MKKLLDNPAFTTYVLEVMAATPDSSYEYFDGMTDAEKTAERTAMYNLASYLLSTYKGTGKTFVLQNWEADSELIQQFGDGNSIPTIAFTGHADWINARQDGVTAARNDYGTYGVQVVHAMEVNRVQDAIRGQAWAINRAVPSTHCDLYSYSAWDVHGDSIALTTGLDFIAANAPPSTLYGTKNIYLGEYGFSENLPYEANGDSVLQEETIRRMTEAAITWGCRYVLYWLILNQAK